MKYTDVSDVKWNEIIAISLLVCTLYLCGFWGYALWLLGLRFGAIFLPLAFSAVVVALLHNHRATERIKRESAETEKGDRASARRVITIDNREPKSAGEDGAFMAPGPISLVDADSVYEDLERLFLR
jgi:hypothetical protein